MWQCEGKEQMNDTHAQDYRHVNIRLTEAEIAAVRDITKVDALGPAVVAIVRKAIADHVRRNGGE